MQEYVRPPLKRHLALQPLSRDHYVGLVQARHLIKSAGGSEVDRRTALREFSDAWVRDIATHFDDEERLLPHLMDPADRQRMLDEHARLRELACEARTRRREVDPGPQWMQNLGQLLEAHIRWEERELFPAIQATADADRLETLAQETDIIEKSRNRTRRVGGPDPGAQ